MPYHFESIWRHVAGVYYGIMNLETSFWNKKIYRQSRDFRIIFKGVHWKMKVFRATTIDD